MKRKKNKKNLFLKLSAYLPIVFIFVPYFFISLLDTWKTRWFFAFFLFVLGPLIPLWLALDTRIPLTRFNPEELPKKRFILRHLGIFFRLFLITIGIGTLVTTTIPYARASIQLAANGWQLEHITGVIETNNGTYPGAIVFRDIRLKDSVRKLELLYPFGKKGKLGSRYEFLIIPETDYIVNFKEIPSW
jgi:membrane protease YdiL (CAAX protease family)